MADMEHYSDEMDDLLDAAADDPGVTVTGWNNLVRNWNERFAFMAENPQVDRAERVNRRQEFTGEGS